MNNIYSFYQLISKYQIEIPIIQRDYAQGRDNVKAADVRNVIIEKMKNAVEKNTPLFFDFIYGRVDGNKFIPFDGQQRLTTLFLFHKYVFEKCQSVSDCYHKGDCICKNILGRFSYATRQSSREFCEKLVQENVIPQNSEIKVSKNIRNLSWFYPDWEKDPTVMGMLTMLDEIHNQLKNNEEFKFIAEKLTSGCNCPITFHFVDMGEHKLSDETYVKMNARGKQLTPFENFKASLEQYLEEKGDMEKFYSVRLKGQYDKSQERYTGIDGTWLDLFWNIVNKDKENKELPDSLMMSFFNRCFINVWRCWYAANSKSGKDRKSLSEDEKIEQDEWDAFNARIQKEMPLYPSKDDFVSFDIYRFVIDKCGTDNCLNPIFNILDALCKDNTIANDCQAVWNIDKEDLKWNLYIGVKNNNNRETYPSRVAFYALMKYFATSTDTTSLAQWMRVVWNIIENSTIDSTEPYHSALKLINELSKGAHEIYEFLRNDTLDSGFAEEQIKEEIAKAKQILNGTPRTDGKEWEEVIKDAEKYAFFKGSIRFLFTNENGEENWNDFDTKWEHVKMYYNKEGVCEKYHENALLLRNLISYFSSEQQFKEIYYDNSKWHWKNKILGNIKLCLPVHKLLTQDICYDFNSFESILKDQIKEVQEQLVKTSLITNLERESYYMEDGYKLHVYYANRNSDVYLGELVRERNDILSSFISQKSIICNQKLKHCNFFRGYDIYFSYKDTNFKWSGRNKIVVLDRDWNDTIISGKVDEPTPEKVIEIFDSLIASTYSVPKECNTDSHSPIM